MAADNETRPQPNPDEMFRRSARLAASSRYGSPVKPLGLTTWGLTIFVIGLVVAAVCFLSLSRYARKETVFGVVQPAAGATRVVALSSGVITEVFVADGQTVGTGDSILRISSDPMVEHHDAAPALLSSLVDEGAYRERSAVEELTQARLSANSRAQKHLNERRTSLDVDRIHLDDTLTMQAERLRLAQETFVAGQALHQRELFSTLQLRQREEAVIGARQQLVSIQREIQRNAAAIRELDAEASALRSQASQLHAEAAVSRAQFDQRHAEHLAHHGVVLAAGKPGKVVALSARVGAVAQPGHTLAVILPSGTGLQAELWVPSRAAGFLTVGAPVRLMYDAFPYQKFGVGRGRVTAIAGAPTEPTEVTMSLDSPEALYRVLVSIEAETLTGYGRSWSLTPGMRLTADLVLDDRSLWEWLIDPVMTLRKRA